MKHDLRRHEDDQRGHIIGKCRACGKEGVGKDDECEAETHRVSAASVRREQTINEVRYLVAEVERYETALKRIRDQASIALLGEQLLQRIAIEALKGVP